MPDTDELGSFNWSAISFCLLLVEVLAPRKAANFLGSNLLSLEDLLRDDELSIGDGIDPPDALLTFILRALTPFTSLAAPTISSRSSK